VNFSTKLILIFVLFSSLFLSNCANIIPPSGGEKDTQAPVLVKSNPLPGSINFNSKKIILEFDEFFNLDNPLQNIVISPPMTKSPEYKIIGKKLIITIKEELKKEVTYNINFGDAIKDFNEGNILKNYSFAFATGALLDTLQLKGTIKNAEDNVASENVIVALYKTLDDSVVYNSKPYYFSKTDKGGNYLITNIHSGTYKLFALKDENIDYIYNNNEMIGFADEPLIIYDTMPVTNMDMKLFRESASKTQLIEVSNPELGIIKFIYNRPIQNFKFDASIYKKEDIATINPTKDTITYYYSNYDIKNTVFYITTNNTLQDTVSKELFYIKESEIDKNRIRLVTKSASGGKASMNKSSTKHDLNKSFVVNFNRPFTIVDESKIEVYQDSILLNKEAYSISQDAKDKTILSINSQFLSNKNYSILIKENAIKDILGFTNTTLSKSFSTTTVEDYGTIIITNSITNNKSYILQLKDANDIIVYRVIMKSTDLNKKIILDKYLAGIYKLTVIQDDNNNKRWDTGNYSSKTQAEKIFTINNNINLKAGWETEVDIKF
jgi:coenzyme F420-reducing hydrogenase delta subunit